MVQPPGQGRAAHPGIQGWMEKVLGGLSKARPGESLQELGGGSGNCSPGLSWMSKGLEGARTCSCLEPSETPCKLCPCLGNLIPRPSTPILPCALGAAAIQAVSEVPGPRLSPALPLSTSQSCACCVKGDNSLSEDATGDAEMLQSLHAVFQIQWCHCLVMQLTASSFPPQPTLHPWNAALSTHRNASDTLKAST